MAYTVPINSENSLVCESFRKSQQQVEAVMRSPSPHTHSQRTLRAEVVAEQAALGRITPQRNPIAADTYFSSHGHTARDIITTTGRREMYPATGLSKYVRHFSAGSPAARGVRRNI